MLPPMASNLNQQPTVTLKKSDCSAAHVKYFYSPIYISFKENMPGQSY